LNLFGYEWIGCGMVAHEKAKESFL